MAADPILAAIVRAVEQLDKDGKKSRPPAVILHIGAMFLTWEVISERAFVEQSKALVKTAHQDTEDAIADFVVTAGLSLDQITSGGPDVFIHLQHVAFAGPTGGWEPAEPESSRECWRGRLERIDGFCLGDCL